MAGVDEQDIGRQLIVKADEVDQVGTAISSPSEDLPLSALGSVDGAASTTAQKTQAKVVVKSTARPTLRRDGSAPPPPSQPPPPAPPQNYSGGDPTDSLSLPQLKQLVNQFPKVEQRAYAFQFADAQSFEVEVDEWFQYAEQDRLLLLSSRDSFESRWKIFCRDHMTPSDSFVQSLGEDEPSWLQVTEQQREQFLSLLAQDLGNADIQVRIMFLECIVYILCGTWGITAGLEANDDRHDIPPSEMGDHDRSNSVQVASMHRGADLLSRGAPLRELYACSLQAFAIESTIGEPMEGAAAVEENNATADRSRELTLLLTSWYLLLESARTRVHTGEGAAIRNALSKLEPNFLVMIVNALARFRWQDSASLPLTRLLHLFWKALLLLFGDTKTDLDHAKKVLQPGIDPYSPEASHPVLTASPLDYHLFRQEITSKYPAYNPPLPLVPLELEHKSMLPPVTNHSDRSHPANGYQSGFGTSEMNSSTSIFHQPVHIATPAPSPPPSPVGPGGKAGKKQNYQTNQNFPFLYPPLDDTSNNIGGKGTSEFQDIMVGKKWEGSDIPASIIEAGQLFASRMRMTRAMRQLWKERELFLKHDRGWNGTAFPDASTRRDENDESESAQARKDSVEIDPDIKDADEDLRSRLGAVEDFFVSFFDANCFHFLLTITSSINHCHCFNHWSS